MYNIGVSGCMTLLCNPWMTYNIYIYGMLHGLTKLKFRLFINIRTYTLKQRASINPSSSRPLESRPYALVRYVISSLNNALIITTAFRLLTRHWTVPVSDKTNGAPRNRHRLLEKPANFLQVQPMPLCTRWSNVAWVRLNFSVWYLLSAYSGPGQGRWSHKQWSIKLVANHSHTTYPAHLREKRSSYAALRRTRSWPLIWQMQTLPSLLSRVFLLLYFVPTTL